MTVEDVQALTIQGLFDTLDKWGAAVVTFVPRDEKDAAVCAVIAVQGQPETDEILAAIEAVQKRWGDEGRVVTVASEDSGTVA